MSGVVNRIPQIVRLFAVLLLGAGAALGPIPNHIAPPTLAGITQAPGAAAISDQGPDAAGTWDDDVEYAAPRAIDADARTLRIPERIQIVTAFTMLTTDFTRDLLRPPRA